MGANTFSVGAFPAILPELGAGARLPDWQLGSVVSAYGFARMLTDVPAGLFITHHLRRALVLAPLFLAAGVLCLAAGGPLALLLLGRVLMGAGHTLAMVAGLTAVLRHREAARLASSLSALELTAMLGMLGGVTVIGLLPPALPWNWAFALTCSPLLLAAALVPATLATLPPASGGRRPLFSRAQADGHARGPSDHVRAPALATLAFAAGGAVALAYATLDTFVVPIRASREFGFDRVGVARLLMVVQVCDILALLPVGALADRRGAARVHGVLLLVFAAGAALVGFGALWPVVAGCALYGLAMSGWMLPLGVLRAVTPAAQIAWRTALYRVWVDGGIFLGPFLAGLLWERHPRLLPGVMAVALAAIGLALLARRPLEPLRVSAPSPSG
jgi:MFS family permease